MSDASITPRQLTATIVVCASNALETWRASWSNSLGRYLICDGIADDVEIQAAIDALPANSGEVLLSEGIFNLVATITAVNYLSLKGMGRGMPSEPPDSAGCTVLVQAANYTPLLNLNSTNGVVLRDFKIRGGQGTYATGRAIQVVGADWLTMGNLYLNGITGEGIYGEYSGGKGAGWFLQDIYIRGGGAEGVYLNGVTDSWLDNVLIGGCAGEGGFFLRDGSDLILKGCRADWNTKRGFYLYGGSNLTLIGCTADYNNYSGLEVLGHHDSIFEGLRVHNNGKSTGGVWQYGTGLRLCNSLRNTILGCRFRDGQTPKTQQYGILEDETSDYNLIVENDVIGNGTLGIYLPIAGAHTILRANMGFLSENSGTATVTAAVTEIKVTHGLAAIPTRVQLTPTSLEAVTHWWVSSKDSDADGLKFTITVDQVPGGAGAIFDWRAQVGEG